ncbi:MAG: NADP-dependent malic enzyme [Lentimicrobiaceae bacterium]|jgi:malate dehydrogenase (oxaloacetate-decarboxylating)(NADP+)
MTTLIRKNALTYHSEGRPGKIEVVPTKPHSTQRDLSLAYSPGVAEPCLEIQAHPEDVYKYTAKGNLVAVISNGTAVLGLGDIGAEAGKPVMEGKGLLFKIFADIDVFDIEVNEKDIDKFVAVAKAISPTFGGINLEDIKAPECFEIEERLKAELDIPVMHDDQHGTAIITSAGLLNALVINGKKIEELKIVVSGAGAAAISCTRLYIKLGVLRENIIMLDSKGVLNRKRTDLNKYKAEFVTDRDIDTLEQAMDGADMFLGLSVAGAVKPEYLMKMASNPIVFALANPVPEISYPEATAARPDIIMGTGRSDFPNQVNNVLGFPYVFRGALDVRARAINEEMKLAAAYALADLAKLPVPEEVNIAYNIRNLKFGSEYIIPKPSDPRLILFVATAVAKAAMETGVARKPITDWAVYKSELSKRLGLSDPLMRQIKARAQSNPKRVIFAEAENYKVLKAAEIVLDEGIAFPILLGNKTIITQLIKQYDLELPGVEIIDPSQKEQFEMCKTFADQYYKKQQRKGVNAQLALDFMSNRNFFAPSMVENGYADAVISGLTTSYAETIRPALRIIGKKKNSNVITAMYIMLTKKGPIFFADTTINMNPSSETLVEIALQTAEAVKAFNIEPRIAMLSYSNFGSTKGEIPLKVKDAVAILHRDHPELIVDGDMQANFAINNEMLAEHFPFSKLVGAPANTLIFPYLTASNIAYKLIQEIAEAEAIGPILMGLDKSIHVLQMGSSVNEIVNMTAIAVIDAQANELREKNNIE